MTIIDEGFEKETLREKTPSALWQKILEKIEKLRKDNDLVKLFPVYFNGEYLFGLSEPHIMRLIESLPGVETLTNYAFKFGRLQLLDMPLTINPTGCARSEPKLRTHFRKSHAIAACNSSNQQRSTNSGSNNGTNTSSNANSNSNGGNNTPNYYNDGDEDEYEDGHEDDYSSNRGTSDETVVSVSYTKQFVLSKSTQFKKLKAEWRSNCYLKKSAIQVSFYLLKQCSAFLIYFDKKKFKGLGLYAARDLEKNTMIIEYIGELIRNEVANRREKVYSEQVILFIINTHFR